MKKSKLLKLMAVCAPVLFGAIFGFASDAHAQCQFPEPSSASSPVLYKIVNAYTGKVMDVAFNSTQASYRIHQWEYMGLPSQHWFLLTDTYGGYRIVNLNSRHSIEPQDTSRGAKLWQHFSVIERRQSWLLYCEPNVAGSVFRISNLVTQKVVDIEHNSTGNGGNMNLWDYIQSVQTQLWKFERVN
jgi:hypothetical protein